MEKEIKNLGGRKMKFGVSMSLCKGESGRYLDERDLKKTYLHILKDFTEFVKEEGFEIIEMASIPLFPGDLLFLIANEIKVKISLFKTVIYHLPLGEINISALHQRIRREAIEETKKHIDLCQKIGINKVVMHPGCFAAMPDIYLLMEKQTREMAREGILEIFDYCKARGIELLIENLHRNEPLFQKPEEFQPFIKRGVGMCVDTVHAFEASVDPLDFIRKFVDRIAEIHLTDGIYKDPITHYAIGSGEVDILAVLTELKKINYRGEIILEVESKEDLLKSKKYLERNRYL